MPDPLSHEIFKDLEPPELHKEGYERLVACYKNSLKRMKVIYKQDVIKTKSRNAQERRTIEVRRTKHKDYTEKKRTARQGQQNKEISQPEVLYMQCCGLNSYLIFLYCFSYKLTTLSPRNEEKYFHMKNKYLAVYWIIKKEFQLMYMMKSFNNLEPNGIRKGFMDGGIIVLIKIINLYNIIVL